MWKIIICSLIGISIIAVHNFQRFSDRSFVSAFELIFILKLEHDIASDIRGLRGIIELYYGNSDLVAFNELVKNVA